MKHKLENVMKNKKVMIALMEILIAIGCIIIFYLLLTPKDRVKETTYSYSKVEEVSEYRIVNEYMTRVMPLTSYETFKGIAENTLNSASEDVQYAVKVYSDAEKTEEVTEGYIASGMVVEGIVQSENAEELPQEESEENTIEDQENNQTDESVVEIQEEVIDTETVEEEEDSNNVSYTVSVLGDMTNDGYISIGELTKLIKGVVGLTDWNFTEEEKLSADISGDNEINVVDIELCINYIVFGKLKFEEEPIEPTKVYTVIFKDEDGTIISTNTYEEGEKVEIPQAPEKEADETYTYKFAGWTPEVEKIVTRDAEYTATYTKKEKEVAEYTVVFKDEDGTVISTNTYEEGEKLEIPQAPEKESDETYTYEFAGWTPEVEETVIGDAEYTATYTSTYKEYTVEFKNGDGSVITSKTYHYGDTVEVPENPTKEADGTYTYEFTGWTPEVEGTVTGNAEYIATYTSIYKEYTVEFKNEDGSIITSKTYHYGDTVELPETPVKEADDNGEYEFVGWGKEVSNVTKDEVYIATYNIISYKIAIQKEDGTTVKYVSFEKAFSEVTDDNITIKLIENVTESINIPEGKNITLDLNNYKINSDLDSTITNNGNLLIVDNSIEKGATIENTNNTAIINNGNLTIGYDDGTVEENVIIKGVTNAIKNNNNFYMYDGTLMGKITITGNNAIIPEGEEYGLSIKEENGLQKATIQIIEIPVALVGETYYTDLQQAIDENDNTTIYIVKKNIELISTVTVDETKTLTIDLNGNTITKSSTGYVIENSGTLTLTNTSQNSEGNITNTSAHVIYNKSALNLKNININSYNYGVYNEKDLYMENANIESSNSYAIYNTYTSNDINFNMLGGNARTLKSGTAAIYNFISSSLNATENISAKITDALIEGGLSNTTGICKITLEATNTTIKGYRIYNSGSVDLILKDSKVETNDYGIYNYTGFGKVTLENTEMLITGTGTSYGIYSQGFAGYNIVIDKNSQITVNSKYSYGIFSDYPSHDNEMYSNRIQLINGNISAVGSTGYGVLLKSGIFDFFGGSVAATTKTIDATIGSITEDKQMQTVQEEDKYVSTLIDAQYIDYIASVEEEQFYTLEDAIEACTNTEETTTITILCDYEQSKSVEISEEKNITIDLNGHNITTYGEFINQGKLEITDSSEAQTGIIEEKTSRAIVNKGKGIFTLSGGKILLNSTTMSKRAISNLDQASINIKSGEIEIDNSVVTSHDIIYNKSTGNIGISGGKLKGVSSRGTLYGIYNFVDDSGGSRNIIVSNISIEISYSNANVYGIYNYTTHSSSVTDTSRDTINLSISNSNINIEGSNSSSPYGIYNYTYYGRDTIKMNLQNCTLNVTNNYYRNFR